MNQDLFIKYALEEGVYKAAIVDTNAIVFDPSFRPYCEENLCGQYNANYTCPPICGSPEEMKNRILKYEKVLVLQSVWEISDYSDKPAIKHAKTEHNAATIRLVKRLREEGRNGVIVGSSGCALCSPCAINDGKPCRFPELAFSCMSAYCIYVKHLAEMCEMTYTCEQGKLALFGMYAFE